MSAKLLDNPTALVNMVRRVAVEAGEITLKYFDDQEDYGLQHKQDGSPVTLADHEAEIFIREKLGGILPGIPCIAEEAADLGKAPELGENEYFWLVDPLDGTKAFIRGEEDFTVNIALIRNGEPLLGVVYAPATGILYAGHSAGQAIRWNQDTGKEKLIKIRMPPARGIIVITSALHGNGGKVDKFLEQFKVEKRIQKSSSLKICAIAEGKADLYPRFGLTCEWDTAAGHAVLRAAGGYMTDMEGNELRYGGANPGFYNPEFVASSFEWLA